MGLGGRQTRQDTEHYRFRRPATKIIISSGSRCVARALENPDKKPTYLDYFGMTQPPFAKLSVPSQLFHSDQYSMLADHLATATEQSDFPAGYLRRRWLGKNHAPESPHLKP